MTTTPNGESAPPDIETAEELVALAERLRDRAVAADAERQAPPRRQPTSTTKTPTDGAAGRREAERRYGSTEPRS